MLVFDYILSTPKVWLTAIGLVLGLAMFISGMNKDPRDGGGSKNSSSKKSASSSSKKSDSPSSGNSDNSSSTT